MSHSPTLEDFPLEVLNEIVLLLDFPTLESFRMTSKKIHTIVESRYVWFSLAQKYNKEHFNAFRPENGPIESLSDSELRRWILKRLEVKYAWMQKNPRGQVRFYIDTEYPLSYFLVPGGRWLITGNENGSVYAYDIQRRIPLKHKYEFIPPPEAGNRGAPVYWMNYHICTSSPTLKFYLIIATSLGKRRFDLQIWQVVLEGRSQNARLDATHRKTIPDLFLPHGHDAPIISDKLVARAIKGSGSLIKIVHWRSFGQTDMTAACISLPEEKVQAMYFLGNDRILCISWTRISIHQIPPFETYGFDLAPDSVAVSQPTWSYEFKSVQSRVTCSRIYSCEGSYRFMCGASDGVVGLIIPKSTDSQPIQHWFRYTVNFHSYGHGCLGIRVGLTIRDDIIRFRFSWEDYHSTIRMDEGLSSWVNGGKNVRIIGFDEEMGIVLWRDGEDKFVCQSVTVCYSMPF